MAYSYDQIIQAYTALRIGKAPDKATADSLQLTAGMNAGGQLSDAKVLSLLVNGADATTGVAVLSYQFFTGKSPTATGLTYLVNSAFNAADLNDSYYAKFNLENRYINFAANLGLYGEGATAFASKYGAMSFDAYVASIYQTIIGRGYAESAGVNVDAAVAYLIGTKDAVLQTVRESGMVTADMTAAQVDLAVKAAMAGLVMAASIKADVGLYAAAGNNFMVALAQGTAVYNTDITATYKPSFDTFAHGTGQAIDRAPATLPETVTTPPTAPVTHSYTLRAGVDHITATAQDDTFNATDATLQTGDVLNGGGGNDVLNLNVTSGAYYYMSNPTVSGIETLNITASNDVESNDWSVWSGLTSINLTSSYGGALIRNVPAAADVSVTANAVPGNSDVFVTRGVNVDVTATVGAGVGFVRVEYNTGDTNITRTNTGAGAHGDIKVNESGGDIYITQNADLAGVTGGNTQYNSNVFVDGSTTTNYVEIINSTAVLATLGTAGIGGGHISIRDYNTVDIGGLGSITDIKVEGFDSTGGPSEFRITDNALTDLTLVHGEGTVYIDNGYRPAGYSTSLTLNVNDVDIVLREGGSYDTLRVITGATASTISDIVSSSIDNLVVGGTGVLNLDMASAPLLHYVNVYGTAVLNATFGAGDDTIVLGKGASTISTGAGADQIIVLAANAASNTVFSTIFMDAGETLKINAQGAAANFTGTMGAMATGTTFQDYLDSAASSTTAGTTSHWSWFQYTDGNTYLVLDSSNDATFHAGTDIVVKLIGAFNEAGASIANNVLTIQ